MTYTACVGEPYGHTGKLTLENHLLEGFKHVGLGVGRGQRSEWGECPAWPGYVPFPTDVFLPVAWTYQKCRSYAQGHLAPGCPHSLARAQATQRARMLAHGERTGWLWPHSHGKGSPGPPSYSCSSAPCAGGRHSCYAAAWHSSAAVHSLYWRLASESQGLIQEWPCHSVWAGTANPKTTITEPALLIIGGGSQGQTFCFQSGGDIPSTVR